MKITHGEAEAVGRAIGIFGAVLVSTIWAAKSGPAWDNYLMGAAAIAGVVVGVYAKNG